MIEKERLDLLLVERGLVQSREKAKILIISGKVYVDNQKSDKPGTVYKKNVAIEIRKDELEFVSRGGLKLEKAIKVFDIDLKDKITMDVGASTGGFTDCMLKNGAKKVYTVDVGYGQLAWGLRNDPRVVNFERTNIRHINKDLIAEKLDFASIDVSFISLALVLPVLKDLMKQNARIVCLIKPQFEAGKGKVGKNGVIRDAKVHIEVINKVFEFTSKLGFKILSLDYSPIKGAKGNIEYLMYVENSEDKADWPDISSTVKSSHDNLN